MALQKNRVVNSNRAWDAGRVYKVNEVVQIAGVVCQNLTGGNSDPLLLVDWVVVYQDVGLVYSQSEVDAFLVDKINVLDTGWEEMEDTVHLVGSPQLLTAGNTANLSNNKGVLRNNILPFGVTTFFDSATSKLTPALENDFYQVDLMFKVKNSVLSGHFDVWVDITGIGERFRQSRICPKTANTETNINISFSHFTSDLFALNGGVIKIEAITGNLEIYDKQFRIVRVIKGR